MRNSLSRASELEIRAFRLAKVVPFKTIANDWIPGLSLIQAYPFAKVSEREKITIYKNKK
jgi:hypothetical protein